MIETPKAMETTKMTQGGPNTEPTTFVNGNTPSMTFSGVAGHPPCTYPATIYAILHEFGAEPKGGFQPLQFTIGRIGSVRRQKRFPRGRWVDPTPAGGTGNWNLQDPINQPC